MLPLSVLLTVANDSEGYFIGPTAVVSQDPKLQLMTEEIFGSILVVHLV
jgi:acyl-CoA reductase-like NAD-dependent aldehyde dehydrogenase